MKVEVDAVSKMSPEKVSGRPTACRSQSTAVRSTSVAAGEVRHNIAFTPTAATRSSAAMLGARVELEK